MNIYIRTFNTLKQHIWKKRFYLVFLWGFITSTILVAEPIIFAGILSHIEAFITTNTFIKEEFLRDIIIYVFYIIISISFFFLYRYYFVDKNILKFYVKNLEKWVEVSLFTHYSILLEKKPWEIFKKLEKWREWFINFFFFFFLDCIRWLWGVFIIITFMLWIDVKMTLITLSWLPVVLFVWYFFNKKTTFLQKDINDREDIIFWNVSDALSNFSLVKILSLEKSFLERFTKSEKQLLDEQNKISYRWAIAQNYIQALVVIMRLVVLLSWFYFVSVWELTFAKVIIFFMYINFIYWPIWFVFWQFRQVQRWLTWIEAYFEEFEDVLEQENINIWKNIKNVKGNIEFKNVNFWYSDDRKILENINLDIKKGQKVALVGNTWAGKSTIVNLVLRFWEIKNGEILLDGNNIKGIKKSSLRKHIWVVSQDNSLFNLSIEENLKFANPKATKKEIEIALKNAQADFVFWLKDGIKTVIWERGLKLSGGEKQRISIARLFLKNPEILILDEATSALDNATEKKIEKALKKLMKWKTSIIIAHRLSTIQHADIICMLENGKIVESWNYEELMKKKWKFYNLANPDKLILG